MKEVLNGMDKVRIQGSVDLPLEAITHDSREVVPGALFFGVPRFTILVVLDRPQGSIYGGEVAAPVFAEIASRALTYRGTPKDRPWPDTGTSGPAEPRRGVRSRPGGPGLGEPQRGVRSIGSAR